LNDLPPEDADNISKVSIKGSLGTKNFEVGDKKYTGSIAGYYTPSDHSLTLNDAVTIDPAETRTVVYHEVGHSVWDNMHGTKMREFKDIYDFFPEEMPSDYARSDIEEGFAESYSAFHRGTLKPDTQTYRWFKNTKLNGEPARG
jgi:hypothetical protein